MAEIKHLAEIISIQGSVILANIESQTSCASCHAQKQCAMSSCQKKVIEINSEHPEKYQIGQKVTVVLDETLGWIAIFCGYIFPLILVLITLFTTNTITNDDIASATYSLMILIPYYLLLSLFKRRISSKFQFKIED